MRIIYFMLILLIPIISFADQTRYYGLVTNVIEVNCRENHQFNIRPLELRTKDENELKKVLLENENLFYIDNENPKLIYCAISDKKNVTVKISKLPKEKLRYRRNCIGPIEHNVEIKIDNNNLISGFFGGVSCSNSINSVSVGNLYTNICVSDGLSRCTNYMTKKISETSIINLLNSSTKRINESCVTKHRLSKEEIYDWWKKNSSEQIKLTDYSYPINLKSGEKAYLYNTYMLDRGRNSFDGVVLVRPKLEEAKEIDSIGRILEVTDLDRNKVTEVIAEAIGSGQGTEHGTKYILNFDGWNHNILYKNDFHTNIGACKTDCASKDIGWLFIDIDKDSTGKKDLIETEVFNKGNGYSFDNNKTSFTHKYLLFRNGVFQHK